MIGHNYKGEITFMKSIKPGRGPSAMGAVGSVIAIVFGIFWTIQAGTMGAPGFFVLFGIMFIGVGIVKFIYNYKNATEKDRMSIYDITDENEEIDPFDELINKKENESTNDVNKVEDNYKYCPYCGQKIKEEFKFCPSCGRERSLN